MREYRGPSRPAVLFVVIGLALCSIGIAYISYAGRERVLPAVIVPEDDPRLAQLRGLVRVLVHSLVLFLVFLFGSYILVRIARLVATRHPEPAHKEYADAWSNYRLSQDEIDTAAAALDEEFPPDDDKPSGPSEPEKPDT